MAIQDTAALFQEGEMVYIGSRYADETEFFKAAVYFHVLRENFERVVETAKEKRRRTCSYYLIR